MLAPSSSTHAMLHAMKIAWLHEQHPCMRRMEILKIHASKLAKHGDIDYEAVVKLAENFNGADLRNICTEVRLCPRGQNEQSKNKKKNRDRDRCMLGCMMRLAQVERAWSYSHR